MMRSANCTALIVSGAIAAGCGGAARPSPRAVPPARVGAPTTARVVPRPWGISVLPFRGAVSSDDEATARNTRILWFPTAGTDERGFSWGTQRGVIREGRIEWAHDQLLESVVSVTRMGADLYLATADGALVHAHGTLGRLERMDDTHGTGLSTSYRSDERLTVRADDDSFWIGGPDGRLQRVPEGARGGWVDLGFTHAQLGYAIREPGLLMRTVNGGTTFEPFEPPGLTGTPYAVGPSPTGVTVVTTTESVFIPDGAQASSAPSAVAPSEPGGDDAERTRWHDVIPVDWFRSSTMASVMADVNRRRVDVADDAVVLQVRRDVMRVPRQGDPDVIELPGPQLEDSGLGCWAVPIGPRLGAMCSTVQDTRLYEWTRTPAWTLVRALHPRRQFRVVPSGHAVIYAGACDDTDAPLDRTWCWTDGTRSVTHHVLGSVSAPWLGRDWAVGVDLTTSEHRPLAQRLAAPDDPIVVRLDPPQATPLVVYGVNDGTVGALATVDGVLSTGAGDPTTAIALRPLPAGAHDARFADRLHGVAAGPTRESIWSTTDGGATWTPEHVVVDGEMSLARNDTYGALTILCYRSGCQVGGRLFWGEGIQPIATVGSLHAPPDAPPPTPNIAQATVSRPRGTCEIAPRSRPVPPPPPSAEHPDQRAYLVNGWSDVIPPADPSEAFFARAVHWGGVDAGGVFEATSGSGEWASYSSFGMRQVRQDLLLPLDARRDRLIAVRCLYARDADELNLSSYCSDLVIARAGGRLTVHPLTSLLFDLERFVISVRRAVALPNGSVIVMLYREGSRSQATDTVIEIDAHDRLRTLRSFAWDVHGAQRSLAMWHGRLGEAVFRQARASTFEFHPLDGDPTYSTHAWQATTPEPTCLARVAPADAVTIWSGMGDTQGALHMRTATEPPLPNGMAFATLEVNADGSSCFRQLDWSAAQWSHEMTEVDGPLLLQTRWRADHALAGTAVMRDGLHDVVCHMEP